jgi:hypothetical protein
VPTQCGRMPVLSCTGVLFPCVVSPTCCCCVSWAPAQDGACVACKAVLAAVEGAFGPDGGDVAVVVEDGSVVVTNSGLQVLQALPRPFENPFQTLVVDAATKFGDTHGTSTRACLHPRACRAGFLCRGWAPRACRRPCACLVLRRPNEDVVRFLPPTSPPPLPPAQHRSRAQATAAPDSLC